tara:strand:- start:4981 stop:5169 length:189 start_codon:yes stop_codon:yes gene_type:complete
MEVDIQKYVVSWSLTIKQSPLQLNEWQSFNSLDKAKKKYKQLLDRKRLYTASISQVIKSTED